VFVATEGLTRGQATAPDATAPAARAADVVVVVTGDSLTVAPLCLALRTHIGGTLARGGGRH
jgi:hypothetical protein